MNKKGSFFIPHVGGYDCSMVKGIILPMDYERISKFCRQTGTVEYHAVLDILKRPDVHKVIDKYHSAEAWVKALNYQFVEDREYLNRILPAYSDTNIHCVIMLHSPEGQRVFIEDGDKHHEYVEISADEFFTSLNNASDEDVNNFWLHLR